MGEPRSDKPDPSAQHPISGDTLINYVESEMSDDEMGSISLHLAECDECTERARRLYAASMVLDTWTAEAHGEAYRAEVLRTALQLARETATDAGIKRRLVEWAQKLTEAVEAAERLSVEATSALGSGVKKAVFSGLDQLNQLLPAVGWELAPIPALASVESAAAAGRLPVRRTRGGAATPKPVQVKPAQAPAGISFKLLPKRQVGFVLVSNEPPRIRTRGAPPSRLVLMIPVREGLPIRVEALAWCKERAQFELRIKGARAEDYYFASEPSGVRGGSGS